jgi:hypothetical protein
VLDLMPEVRLPAAKVVVHIDGRHAALAQPCLEVRDPPGGWQRKMQQLPAAREVEVIDRVDEQENDWRTLGRAAMRIADTFFHKTKEDAARRSARDFMKAQSRTTARVSGRGQ